MGGGPGGYRTMSEEEMREMFGDEDPFSDFFKTFFGGGGSRESGRRTRAPRAQKGRDIEHEVELTLEEAFHGATRRISIKQGGHARSVDVRIPPGVRDGSRVRAAGEGEAGSNGGAAGDLYLRVRIRPHPVFERQGSDLQTKVLVPLTTAVLGGEAQVPTMDGPVGIRIPPGSRPGRTFRLRGHGLPKLEAPKEKGDLLAVLGVAGDTDTSAWGRGVTIAVLDGGASPDLTLGARLRYLDVGYGLTGPEADARHGTAVASLAAGAAADARGVAPSANVLSIRVLGPDGRSDAFAVAQGIVAAVDAGARVINASLGGYATSAILGEAVDYALAAGVAVVAAAGNDQTTRLTWPAAYRGVVSVGAVDAAGVQALFSNSGEGLQLTAPGYAIRAAAPGGERFLFSGTSASAPVVAGAIAALLSQSEGLDAIQAADLLAVHSNDSGAVGADPDYGRGTLNLGWAMDRANTARVDPAIASQAHDAARSTISVAVQNRGGGTLEGLRLLVDVGGERSEHVVPALAVAATASVTVPVDPARLAAAGRLEVWSQLVLPRGLSDRDTRNNRLGGAITAAE